MGESNRRRGAGALSLTGLIDELIDGEAQGAARVPCGSCRACCHTKIIDLIPADSGDGLDVVTVAGVRQLRHAEDGACIHLGPQGCTVYDKRPIACRRFDCRVFATINVRMQCAEDQITPGWPIQVRTHEERVRAVSLFLAYGEYVQEHPSGGDARDAVVHAFNQADEFRAVAVKLVRDIGPQKPTNLEQLNVIIGQLLAKLSK